MPRGATSPKERAQMKADKQMVKAKALESQYVKPFKGSNKDGIAGSTNQAVEAQLRRTATNAQRGNMFLPPLKSFKKGGKVKKTGVYKLHKNEQVIPGKLFNRMKAKMKKYARKSKKATK